MCTRMDRLHHHHLPCPLAKAICIICIICSIDREPVMPAPFGFAALLFLLPPALVALLPLPPLRLPPPLAFNLSFFTPVGIAGARPPFLAALFASFRTVFALLSSLAFAWRASGSSSRTSKGFSWPLT